ncbi:MAG TPA: MFS transporter [Tepidiformaceae bacterium]|nr:MFS transporter [Tepidiformaceae bacterium]
MTRFSGDGIPTGAGRRKALRGHLAPEWMTRDMQLLIVARAFMSSGRALAGVVAPIYLAKIGFDGSELGILFAVTAIVSALLTGAVAFLSDRLGRKAFIIGVPLLAAAAGVVFALTQNAAIIFVAAAAGSFGRGAGAAGGNIGPYQPAEQAYLADSVAPQVRNSLFGRVAFASSLGAVVGVGVLAWIPDVAQALGLGELNSYRPVFIVLAFVCLVAALLPLPIAPRRAVHPSGGKAPITLPRKSWRLLMRLGVTNGMNGLAIGFFGPFITYWFYTRFNAGPGTVGTLYALINVASMASNLSAASIADRLGVVKAIVVTRAVAAVMIVPMVLAPHFWLAGVVYFVRMMIQRVGLPLRQSYVMGVVPQEERAVVAGLSNLPAQGTSAATPAAAGYLFDHVSMSLPFEIGAGLQCLSAGVYWLFFRHVRPPEEAMQPVETRVPATRTETGEVTAGGQ